MGNMVLVPFSHLRKAVESLSSTIGEAYVLDLVSFGLFDNKVDHWWKIVHSLFSEGEVPELVIVVRPIIDLVASRVLVAPVVSKPKVEAFIENAECGRVITE